jgi:hypothetical protein
MQLYRLDLEKGSLPAKRAMLSKQLGATFSRYHVIAREECERRAQEFRIRIRVLESEKIAMDILIDAEERAGGQLEAARRALAQQAAEMAGQDPLAVYRQHGLTSLPAMPAAN